MSAIEVNGRGNEIYRDAAADALMGLRGFDRYYYDFKLDLKEWKQYDTRQDASYFGVWVNVRERKTFTYCEGDRMLVICPTIETFRAELADAQEVYGDPPPAAISWAADGTRTEYYDTRPTADDLEAKCQ